MRHPTIKKGVASNYAMPGELIVDFGDRHSGGLISIARNKDGFLVVSVYRCDNDVIVIRDVAQEPIS